MALTRLTGAMHTMHGCNRVCGPFGGLSMNRHNKRNKKNSEWDSAQLLKTSGNRIAALLNEGALQSNDPEFALTLRKLAIFCKKKDTERQPAEIAASICTVLDRLDGAEYDAAWYEALKAQKEDPEGGMNFIGVSIFITGSLMSRNRFEDAAQVYDDAVNYCKTEYEDFFNLPGDYAATLRVIGQPEKAQVYERYLENYKKTRECGGPHEQVLAECVVELEAYQINITHGALAAGRYALARLRANIEELRKRRETRTGGYQRKKGA